MKAKEILILEAAEKNCNAAIDMAILIESGEIALSVEGLLRCYAILKKWYGYYDRQADLQLLNNDCSLLSEYERLMATISSHIERFEDIFVDFEAEIIDYFLAEGKKFSEQQRADALLFDKMAQNNEDMAFKDWKNLM